MTDRPLHPVCRLHLEQLTGPFGIWQHASGLVPDQSFGYCTDDVARALVVDLLHARLVGWAAVSASVSRSLAFLYDAFIPASQSFRNFRNAGGSWVDAVPAEDSQGRAILALAAAAAEVPEPRMKTEATALFRRALPGTSRLTALRAISSALLGCEAALDGGVRGETEQTLGRLAGRLGQAFAMVDLEGDWPWPEPVLTYENALLPRALIVAGGRLGDGRLVRAGLRVLDWLVSVQTSPDGSFSPIGNRGWWPRGGERSRFEQQPTEATATILAAEAALRATGDARYRRTAEAAYGWFVGDNDVRLAVADPETGGCHDGLAAGWVNANQGAESTLAWLTALEHIRSMRARRGVAPVRAAHPSGAVAVVRS